MQLLFFDTFSHDSSSASDLNLDLVQFPTPVYVKEVRVIPLGARVSANFPGGVRLGATNPAKVELEFFVNNLRASGASTFESIGLLHYVQNETISLVTSKTIATDGLVLRGKYSAITLAVYGMVSESSHDQLSKQGAVQTHNANNAIDVRVKEEPVRPPESPLPDGNGRTIGESYAAMWTEKHSEVALKAEPPADWMQHEGDWKDRNIKLESDKSRTVDVKQEGITDYKVPLENNNLKIKQEIMKDTDSQYDGGCLDWNRSKEKRFRSGSRERSPPRYRSTSRDRSPGFQYPSRSREESMERDRYRSRSRDSRDRRRSREGSRDLQRSRDGSPDSYHRRSYENSVKDSYRGRSSRDHSVERYRQRSRSPRSYTRDTRTPLYDRSPLSYRDPGYRRDGSRDPSYRREGSRDYSPRDRSSLTRSHGAKDSSRSYPRDRSPRTREYSRERSRSPRDYDRNSLHSSGSRRHFSPRRSHSPRTLRSVSPRRRSASPRSKRSPSPRYTGARSRTRSPFDRRSRTPDRWKKRVYSPGGRGGGRYSRSPPPPVHRPVSRNGHLDPFSPQNSPSLPPAAAAKPASTVPPLAHTNNLPESDVLDNVSDISEGDIPDLPDTDDQPPEEEEATNQQTYIEEISDEEAEWSDDFEPMSLSDYEMDVTVSDIEDPIRIFNFLEAEMKPLRLMCSPTDSVIRTKLSGNIGANESFDNLVSKMEDSQDNEFDDKWIENLEALTAILQEEVAGTRDSDAAVIRIAFSGLDYDAALKQSRPTDRVRHIKSGVKFVLELLNCRSELVTEVLRAGLQSVLWKLFLKEHMAIPSKLLILRAIDRSLVSPLGFRMFVESLYTEFSQVLIAGEKTRTKFALSNILNKVHLGELLMKMNNMCTTNILEITDSGVKELEQGIQELVNVYTNLDQTLSHPSRHLPLSKHFDLNSEQFNNPSRAYFSVMKNGGVINLLTVLLTSPSTSGSDNLTSIIHKLLELWSMTLPGLLFLASATEDINLLTTGLLASQTGQIDEGSTTTNTLCGLNLVHRLHALQYIDLLRFEEEGCEDRKGMETTDILDAIQGLYGMTFTCRGREAVVHVLTLADNLDTVLLLTNHSSMDGDKDMKKSAVRGYANELLLLCVRSSENVDFLGKYAKVLIELGKHDEHSKLCELVSWTRPCLKPENLTTEGITTLLDIIKKNVDNASPVNQENITCLRILANLSVPYYNSVVGEDVEKADLKYRYATLILYSADTLDILVSLLDKVCEDHTQPSLHTATMVGSKGSLILAVLKPVVAICKRILECVISVRGSEYKDLSPLGSLVRVHALLAVVPSSSAYYNQATECASNIISTLLSFTQPTIDPNKDDIAKSLWTEMLKSVVHHVTGSPCNYISGLQLVSQLLPLPLPLPSPRTLSQEEEAAVINSRKLWSAHLHPIQEEIGGMVGELAGFVYPPLFHLFQRVCAQLAGLAPPTASAVLLAIMRSAHSALSAKNNAVSGRLMAQFSRLAGLPHLKAVLLSCLAEEEGPRTEFSRTLELCFTQGSDACQENAIAVLQSLCDLDLSLRTLRSVKEDWDGYLADSLPTADTLLELITVLLNPFTCELRTNFSIQLLTMRTFIMFTETDFTFSILKMCLNSKNRTIFSFLRKLSVDFDPSNPDCIPCVGATLEFLLMLLNGSEEGVYPARNTTLSIQELAWVIQYTLPQESELEALDRRRVHPLSILLVSLEEHSSQPHIKPVQERLKELMDRLGCVGTGVEAINLEEEFSLPTPTPLLTQWSWRQVVLQPNLEDDEPSANQSLLEVQLTSDYWLGLQQYNVDQGLEDEREEVDLLDIAGKYVSDLDLVAEVNQVCKETSLTLDRKKKTKRSALETKALHNKSIISTFKSGGTINLRNQRFNRGSYSRPDMFRTRPPNTSRPPSLHVDDFLVLELKGQQPTGPTGYNKQSIKAAKELFAQREAAAALKPPVQLREATREPVLPPTFRGGRGRGQDRGGSRGYRSSNGQRSGGGFRRDSRGWSPDAFRNSEPRDLGREARPGPREERRFRGRGDRRGWERGRGRDKFSGRGSGKDRDERPRHGRNFTR